MCETLNARLSEPGFQDAKERRREYEVASRALGKHQQESKLAKTLKRCVRLLREAEAVDWREFCDRFTANPHIVVPSEKVPVEVAANGEFFLPLRVVLEDALAPAVNIRLIFDQARGIEPVGQLPVIGKLEPNETKTVRIRLIDRRRQGASDEVRVRVHLSYSGPSNETLTSTPQRFMLRLRKGGAFQEIPNPFRDYASGVPVDDPIMFFGREALIEDITTHLIQRPVGRCYGLYGQKRSGKSSLTGQVRGNLLGPDVIVCSLSMGTIDRSEITTSFVTEVLDQLREQLASRLNSSTFASLLTRWPEQRDLAAGPLASFRKALSATRALLRQEG
ncbi:MAG: ATP-binding protein, partial [Alphaproteobacteria bacterium]